MLLADSPHHGRRCYRGGSEWLRKLALHATELERASAATIRCRLLKIGAAMLRNTRRVRVMLASHHPLRELFAQAATRLAALSP